MALDFAALLETEPTPSLEETIAELPEGLRDLLGSRRLFAHVRWQDYTPDDQVDRIDVTDLEDGEAASSQLSVNHDLHAIMFDIDVPASLERDPVDTRFVAGDFEWWVPPSARGAWLIPSSTEGHSHLYVHVDWPWHRVEWNLRRFRDAGVVEEGYHKVSAKRGYTSLRLPWIRKGATSG
jgi:hypothetical protein